MWQPSRSYRHSLLFDPSMSALAIIETQKLPKVSARTITMGFVMGDMMTKQLRIQLTLQLLKAQLSSSRCSWIQLTLQLEAQLRIQLTLQLEAKLRIQLTLQLEVQRRIQLTLQVEAELRTQNAACGLGGCGTGNF